MEIITVTALNLSKQSVSVMEEHCEQMTCIVRQNGDALMKMTYYSERKIDVFDLFSSFSLFSSFV